MGDLPSGKIASTCPDGVLAIEDLIPLEIGIAAVKRYVSEFLEPEEAAKLHDLRVKDVSFTGCTGTHDALENAVTRKITEFHLDKVGFARSVIDVLRYDDSIADAASTMDGNFRVLFRELGRRQRQAMREIASEKTGAKIKRLKRSFMLDHPVSATREEATLLLEDVEAGLDNSVDAEDLKSQIRAVRREFELDDEPTEPIKDYGAFRDALETLVYREVNEAQEKRSRQ